MTQYLNGVFADAAARENAAKLRKLSHLVQEGTLGTVVLEREWIEVDATLADDLKAAIVAAGLTATNPKADQQAYAGAWTVGDVRIDGDDSRAVTVIQVLVLPDSAGVVSTWRPNCDSSVTRTTYFARSKAQYDAIVALYADSTNGVTVDISPFRTNEQGLCDFTVTATTIQPRNYPNPATGVFSTGQFVTKTSFSTEREWQQIGLTDDANMRAVTDSDGVLKSRQVTIADDCSKKVTTRESEATTQTSVELVKQIEAFQTRTVETAKNETLREVAETVQTQNQVVTTTSELTETPGRFDNKREVVAGTPDAEVAKSKVIKAFETVEVLTARNETTREAAPATQTAGTIVKTRSEKNALGSFDNEIETTAVTADADVINQRQVTQFEDLTVLTARNEATREAPITSVTDGKIVKTSSEKNDAGRYDNTREERLAVADADVGKEKRITSFDVTTTETARNEVTAETEQTDFSAGQIKTTKSVKNDAGRFDNSVETVATVSDADVENEHVLTTFEERTVETARNEILREAEVSSVTGGLIVKTGSKKNEAGRFDNSREEILAVAQADVRNEKVLTAFDKTVTVTARNEESRETVVADNAFVPGVVTKTSSELNAANLFDNTREDRTVIADADVNNERQVTAFEDLTVVTARNETDREAPVTSVGNRKIVKTRSEKNEAGKFDNSREERLAVADAEVEIQKQVTVFDTTEVLTARNETNREIVEANQAAQVQNQIIKTTSTKTETGTFDNAVETKTLVAVTDVSKTTEVTLTQSKTVAVDRNATAPATPVTTFVPGSITRTTVEKTAAKSFDNTTEVVTAVAAASTTEVTTRSTGQDRTVVVNENQETPLTPAASTDGTIVTTTNEKNDLGRFRTTLDTVTPKSLSVAAYDAEKTLQGSRTREIIKNDPTQPTLTGVTYGSVHAVKNEAGLWDGTKEVFTYYGEIDLTGAGYGSASDKVERRIEKQAYPCSQGYRWRYITITFSFGFRGSFVGAQSQANGGLYPGTRVWHVKDNIFGWKKVTSIVADSTWKTTTLNANDSGT
jgi:hypothetical protein